MEKQMMDTENQMPKVSVIIPFYNTENYIQTCLESVLNQTYQDFEIICISDGSQDQSLSIVQHIMLTTDKIRLIQIENHGQGYARNLALKQATGKYVLFVDSDDWIEPKTLELTVRRAEEEKAELTVFDYRYYKPIGKTQIYNQTNTFFSNQRLLGDDCRKLFEVQTLYSVNILYSREFLIKNRIEYMEGYIYEDVPFMTKVILCAERIALIHSPLYRITINQTSTTKVNTDSDKHYKGFIAALSEIIPYVNELGTRNENVYHLYLNLFRKFLHYYSTRIPKKYRTPYLSEFLNLYGSIEYLPDLEKSRFFSYFIKNRTKVKNNAKLFQLGVYYLTEIKPKVPKTKKKIKEYIKKGIAFTKKVKRKLTPKRFRKAGRTSYQTFLKQGTYNDVILFMGFDYRYTGNSRYLFDEMVKTCHLHRKQCFFVTDDVRVPAEYRIEPKSERCDRFVARAKTVIFESWIPLEYKKRTDANWIQLWHGTPLKKLLFDSNEKYLNMRNPLNKHYKFTDLPRWDYFLVNNENIGRYFETAFLMPEHKIIDFGYPRVKYLLEKKSDFEYRKKLKEKFGFDPNKKTVVYFPTWRDCNYRLAKEDLDTSYFLDLEELQNALGEQYEIAFKDHPYLSGLNDSKFRNMCEYETQELLLACDCLITDYSSVFFDAVEIDLPFVLYCKDFEENDEARGIYSDIWEDVAGFECKNEKAIAERIKNYQIDESYGRIKEKYGYRESGKQKLVEFIYNLR